MTLGPDAIGLPSTLYLSRDRVRICTKLSTCSSATSVTSAEREYLKRAAKKCTISSVPF